MRVYRQRAKKRVPTLLKVLLTLVLAVGVSFSLAWVWHTTEQSSVAAPQPIPEERVQPVEETVSDEMVSSVQAASPEDTASAEEIVPEPLAAPAGAVPESSPVDDSYFDDAIFFGDSITTGIPLYHVADNAAVVAMTGINTESINTEACIDIGGEERVTFLAAADTYGERSKIYVLVGGNSLGMDEESYVAGYRQFVRSLKERYPQAVIYLQSLTPVVDGYVNEFAEINNELIDQRNKAVLALAQEQRVYYLDIASAFKNESGALPEEASPYDGMHFTPEYYMKWIEYLKTHTVTTEGTK